MSSDKLEITVLKAVVTKDESDLDLFVVLQLGEKLQKTKIIKNSSREPEWMEKFVFERQGDDILRIQLMESDTINDDIIGEQNVVLEPYLQSKIVQQEKFDMIYQGNQTAEVYLEIQWIPSEKQATKQIVDDKYTKKVVFSNMKAKLTRDLETFGKQDPFVQIYLAEKNFQRSSEAKDAGETPVWFDSLIFLLVDEKVLTIKIFDEGSASNSLICEGKIDLEQLKFGKNDSSIPLFYEGKEAGQFGFEADLINLKAKQNMKQSQVKKVDFSVPAYNVRIEALRGQLTRDTETFGQMDPYAIVCIGQQMEKTAVHNSAGNSPIWVENFKFRVIDEKYINITVYDYDEGSNDDIVGIGKVPLEEYLKYKGMRSQKCEVFFEKESAGIVYFDIFVDDSEIRAEQERLKKDKEQEIRLKKLKEEEEQLKNEKLKEEQERKILEELKKEQEIIRQEQERQKQIEQKRQQEEKIRQVQENKKIQQIKNQEQREKLQEEERIRREQEKERQEKEKQRLLQEEAERRKKEDLLKQSQIDQEKRLKEYQIKQKQLEEQKRLEFKRQEDQRKLEVTNDLANTEQMRIKKQQQSQTFTSDMEYKKKSYLDSSYMGRTHNYIYGPGMSEFQSATSLQHSVTSTSFTKDERFKYNRYRALTNNSGYVQLPSIFETNDASNTKGPGIGYGKKQMYPAYHDKKAEQFPGVGQYNQRDEKNPVKYTFGHNHETFKKVFQKGMTYTDPYVTRDLPGPNHYNIKLDDIGKEKKHYSISQRQEKQTLLQEITPGPTSYSPDPTKFMQQKFNGVGFGYGTRPSYRSNSLYTPGPGNYNIPSKFDKYQKKQLKK